MDIFLKIFFLFVKIGLKLLFKCWKIFSFLQIRLKIFVKILKIFAYWNKFLTILKNIFQNKNLACGLYSNFKPNSCPYNVSNFSNSAINTRSTIGRTIKGQSQKLQFGVLGWCSGDKNRVKTLNNPYSIFK